MTAQGIEAGTGETAGLDPQGESPVGDADAPYILPPPLRDDGPLETMARAIEPEWVNGDRYIARQVIIALSAAGFAIVPREPTQDMISAGIIERHEQPTPEAWSLATANIYRAMLASYAPIDTKEGE